MGGVVTDIVIRKHLALSSFAMKRIVSTGRFFSFRSDLFVPARVVLISHASTSRRSISAQGTIGTVAYAVSRSSQPRALPAVRPWQHRLSSKRLKT